MMKKLICLLMAAIVLTSACLLFSGCNKIEVEIDMQAIVAANKTEALLKLYDNFMVKADDGRRSIGYYAEDEFTYEWSDAYTTSEGSYKAYQEIITADYYSGITGDTFYSLVYAGGKRDMDWQEDLVVNPELFLKETLISSKEKDGMIVFKTRLSEEAMIALGYWQEGLYEGCYYETVYTMEKDTLVIKSIQETFVDKVSRTKSTIEYVTIANTERPEQAVKIYDHVNSATETVTATVVFDPGTENEKSESFTVPKGDTVYFNWEGDYNKVYKNAELTEVLDITRVSVVANEDVTIYLVKNSK